MVEKPLSVRGRSASPAHRACRTYLDRTADRIDTDGPTERFEKQSYQLLAAAYRQRRNHGLKTEWRVSASSCRALQTPVIAVRKALFSATERKDDAA